MAGDPAWTVVSRRELFDGRPWLRVWAEDLELPDGRIVDDFYALEMPDYAMVFATAAGRVLVQHEYKHGARRVGLHLPAGYLEPGEDALTAARRELREETGYVSDDWTALGAFACDGNRGAGRTHVFRARNVRRVGPSTSDDLEDTETLLVPTAELRDALAHGEVPVLSSAAAIALALLDER